MFNATAYRVTALLFEGGKRRKLEENHINDESQELLATLFIPASFVCPSTVRCGAKGVRKGNLHTLRYAGGDRGTIYLVYTMILKSIILDLPLNCDKSSASAGRHVRLACCFRCCLRVPCCCLVACLFQLVQRCSMPFFLLLAFLPLRR